VSVADVFRCVKGEGPSPFLFRFSTGALSGYIGITEARLPKECRLSNVTTFREKIA
jgi:hypothetical protein